MFAYCIEDNYNKYLLKINYQEDTKLIFKKSGDIMTQNKNDKIMTSL